MRIFMGRMLQLFRKNTAINSTKIVLDIEFFRDLTWISKFLSTFNGIVIIDQTVEYDIFVDASSKHLCA